MIGQPPRVWLARMSGQLLTRPARTCQGAVERLLAVQAQDPRGFRLALRVRTAALHVSDVERALDNRELVVSWLNRFTLHLVRAEDYWWLHALTTPQLRRASMTRLQQEGVTPEAAERGVDVIVGALANDGPLTRVELRDRLRAAGVRTEGQALVHLLACASFREHVVRGPLRGREQAFVLARDWLGTPPTIDRDQALAELARRYLAGHGPATERDLAKWANITLGNARAAFAAIANDIKLSPGGLADLRKRADPVARRPPLPRLVGPYEPLLLGWVSRAEIVPEPHARVVTDNGLFRPFLLVDGRAQGTWKLDRKRVVLSPFAPLAPDVTDALDAEAADIVRYLEPRKA